MDIQQEIESIEREIEQLEDIISKRKERIKELKSKLNETFIPIPNANTRPSSSTSIRLVEELSKEQ